MNVTSDPDLADINQFMIKIQKQSTLTCSFFDSKSWQSLSNKCTGEFLAAKTLREKFGGLNIMKSILSLDETPSALERYFKVATKFMRELPMNIEMESIPLEGLLSLVGDIHVKTQEASQNTDLNMQEFLGIDKALQSIQGELLNNVSKLTEIINTSKDIPKSYKKWKMIPLILMNKDSCINEYFGRKNSYLIL